MRRRAFLNRMAGVGTLGWVAAAGPWRMARAEDEREVEAGRLTPERTKAWWAAWERSILGGAKRRYCDTETGEQIGWLMGPFLNGFAHAHALTREPRWMEMLVDWAGAWLGRAVKEPDGYAGWPKRGSGGSLEERFLTDSLLGEAMGFRPLVRTAERVLKDPALEARWGATCRGWLEASRLSFEKWSGRGCWRAVPEGGVWVVSEFGLDDSKGGWTEGYARRGTEGFSHPANKQNAIARWLIAMHDATGDVRYRERASDWWKVMKSRIRRSEEGRRCVWNYWDPSGPWDFGKDRAPRHWVGVHPNGGYYDIDVDGIVDAFEHVGCSP